MRGKGTCRQQQHNPDSTLTLAVAIAYNVRAGDVGQDQLAAAAAARAVRGVTAGGQCCCSQLLCFLYLQPPAAAY